MTPPDEGGGPADADQPPICPLMRRLILEIARAPPSPSRQEREGMMERLADLEAEGLAADVPSGTLEAIREARIRARVADLMAWAPVVRGH